MQPCFLGEKHPFLSKTEAKGEEMRTGARRQLGGKEETSHVSPMMKLGMGDETGQGNWKGWPGYCSTIPQRYKILI